MDNLGLSGAAVDHAPQSSRSSSGSFSALSPSMSTFSRGHSSRSSASTASITSSPIPPRDSFDLYGSIKRLEDVTEEPQERDEEWTSGDDNINLSAEVASTLHSSPSPIASPVQAEYSLGDQDAWSTTSSGHHHFKRQRSTDHHRYSLTDRVASRFGSISGSISRKWRNKSGVGPQLSIITHGGMPQRSSSATSSRIVSPALSAISKHESLLPSSPITATLDETLHESTVVPIYIDIQNQRSHEEAEEDFEQGQATTPLLPPMMAELSKKHNSPLQSPLQSPSIAPTPCIASSRVSMDGAAVGLPSPPLSTRPSMASMQRSRGDTGPSLLPADIPHLALYEEVDDPWDARLGHANFSIHPEPYRPNRIELDTYKEFRANWEHARKQYAQHIARTTENYGQTSRVYKLTQQKWNEIDDEWKRQDAVLSSCLSSLLARLSDEVDGTPDSPCSINVLEQPVTRIVVPAFDKSGKFPEIGDADIVGPMFVGPAKAVELRRKSPDTPPDSPKKRSLFKYFSDVLGRSNNNNNNHR